MLRLDNVISVNNSLGPAPPLRWLLNFTQGSHRGQSVPKLAGQYSGGQKGSCYNTAPVWGLTLSKPVDMFLY